MVEPVLQAFDELTHDDWSALSEAVLKFEEAWKRVSTPDIIPLLRPAGDPLRLRMLVELVRIDQEHRWRIGDKRHLEDYLKDWPELLARPRAMTELLQYECLTRFCHDDPPQPADVSTRYPQLVEQIDLDQLRVQAAAEKCDPSTEQAEQTPTLRFKHSGQEDAESSVSGQKSDPSAFSYRSGRRIGHLTGRQFGRYEIRRLVATGGMGVVYEARDTELNRIVALKIPRGDMTQDRNTLARFLNEARAAAAIRHPHVCPIYDVGEVDGQQFLTMPLVEGVSLSAWLEQRAVDPREACELLRKLASAVQAVHDAGIRHRDIKASNVMLDQRGEPLLMDFGLARVPQSGEQLTHSGSLIGTPAYMAPEQIRDGAAAGDERSDVYSLGVLLFQMLTGRMPFDGPMTRVLVDIATQEPPGVQSLRPDVDADLAALCRKAMARNPADRFQTATEFETALREWLAPYAHDPGRRVPPDVPQVVSTPPMVKPASGDATTSSSLPVPLVDWPGRAAAPPPDRRRTAIRGLAAAAVVLVAGFIIRIATDNAELVIVAPGEGVGVAVRHVSGREKTLALTTGENSVTVRSGDVEVVLAGTNADQYEITENHIALKRGDRKVVEITRRPLTASRDHKPSGEPLASEPQSPTSNASAWDQLDPVQIPPRERTSRQPEGLVAVLGEHRQRSWHQIQDSSVSLDGSMFVVQTDAGVFVWNAPDWNQSEFFPLPFRTSVALLPDGRLAAGRNSGSIHGREALHLFSMSKEPGRLTETTAFPKTDEPGGVASISASKDGRWVASFRSTLTNAAPSALTLWNIADHEPRQAARFSMEPPALLYWCKPSFSPDGRWFCFPNVSDRTVRIVDLQSSPPVEVAKLVAPDGAPDGEPGSGFVAVAFVGDGRLATCDGEGRIWLWNVTREPRRTAVPAVVTGGGGNAILLGGAAQSPVIVACNQNQGFQVWDLSNAAPELRCQWSFHGSSGFERDNIQTIAISPDAHTLMTGHHNGIIRFWDITGEEAIERFPLTPNPTLSSSGAFDNSHGPFVVDDLLLATNELRHPGLWQVEGDRLVSRSAPADSGEPLDMLMAQSADGLFLAIRQYDVNKDINSALIFHRDGAKFEPVRDISRAKFQSAALNRDGTRLALGVGPTIEIREFSGTRSRRLASSTTSEKAFHQITFLDDHRILTRSMAAERPSRLQIWDVQPPEIKRQVELPEDSIGQFALSPDGRILATGGELFVRCRNLGVSPPRVTPGFTDRTDEYLAITRIRSVGAVAFSPDGRTLAANTLRMPPDGEEYSDSTEFGYGIDLIDVTSGKTNRRLTYPGPVRNIQFTADGRHLVTANANSTIYVVRLEQLPNSRTGLPTTGVPREAPVASPSASPANPPSIVAQHGAWDQLDPAAIPLDQRIPGQPPELVAILGRHGTRHFGSPDEVAIHPDGRQAVTLGIDGLRFWDLETGRMIAWDRRFPESNYSFSVSYSANGNELLFGRFIKQQDRIDRFPVTPDVDADPLPLPAERENARYILAPDGKQAFRWRPQLPGVLLDCTTDTPTIVATTPEVFGPNSTTIAVAFSRDSQQFAFVEHSDRTIHVLDLAQTPPVERHHLIAEADAAADRPSKGFQGVAFAPDGRLATADNNGQTWLWDVSGDQPQRLFGFADSGALSFAADAPALVVYENSSVGFRIWDLDRDSAHTRHTINHSRRLLPILGTAWSFVPALTPDGQTLVTGHVNGAAIVWDVSGVDPVVRTPQLQQPNVTEFPLVVLPAAIATCDDELRLRLWQPTKTGLRESPGTSRDESMRYWPMGGRSADGRVLVTGPTGVGPSVMLWNWDRQELTPRISVGPGNGHHAALSQDKHRLAISYDGSDSGRIEFWDVSNASARLERTITGDGGLHQMEFAAGDSLLVANVDHKVGFWQLSDPEARFEPLNSSSTAYQFAISLDSQILAFSDSRFGGTVYDLRESPPRLKYRLSNGPEAVGGIAISPDGKQLAVSDVTDGLDWGISIYDLATGAQQRRIRLPGWHRHMLYTDEGRHLVVANADETVYVLRLAAPPESSLSVAQPAPDRAGDPTPWDQLDPAAIPASSRTFGQPEQLVAVLGEPGKRHWGAPNCIIMHPDGKQVATCSNDGIRFWDTATGRPLGWDHRFPSGHWPGVSFDRDGKNLLFARFINRRDRLDRFPVAAPVADLKPQPAEPQLDNGIRYVFSPDRRYAVRWRSKHSGDPVPGALIDLSGPAPKPILELPELVDSFLPFTSAASFSPDGTLLAVAPPADRVVRILDLGAIPPVEKFRIMARDEASFEHPSKGFSSVAFAPDGRLATADGNGRTWLWSLAGDEPQPLFSFADSGHLSFAAEAPVLIVFSGETSGFRVWEIAGTLAARRLAIGIPEVPFPTANFSTLPALTPDGQTVVTGHYSCAVLVWDVSGSKPALLSADPRQPSWNNNPAQVLRGAVATMDDDLRIRLWQPAKSGLIEHPATRGNGKEKQRPLASSHDGSLLVTAPLFGAGKSSCIVRTWDGVKLTPLVSIDTGYVFQAALNEDNSRLALALDGQVEFWNLETSPPRRERTLKLERKGISFALLAFAAQDSLLVGSVDGQLRVWNLNDPHTDPPATVLGRSARFAMSPDGRTLASIMEDGRVHRYDLKKYPPQLSVKFSGTALAPNGIAMSPDGNWLAVGDVVEPNNHAIAIYDRAAGVRRQRLPMPGPQLGLSFTADSRHLLTTNADGTVYVLRLSAAATEPAAETRDD